MLFRNRRITVLVGGTLVASVGLIVAACTTDNGNVPLPGSSSTSSSGGGADGGRDRAASSSSSSSGDNGEDGGEEGDGGSSSGNCQEAPVLRDNNKGGFFCAFLDPRDAGLEAGGIFNCRSDETCCNPGKNAGGQFPEAFCAKTPQNNKGQANSPACADQAGDFNSEWPTPVGTTWECGDSNNCAGGDKCCIYTSPTAPAADRVNIGPHQDLPASCGAKQAFKYGGSRCAASCDSDKELELCSKSEPACAGGKTCTPFEVVPGGRELATCL